MSPQLEEEQEQEPQTDLDEEQEPERPTKKAKKSKGKGKATTPGKCLDTCSLNQLTSCPASSEEGDPAPPPSAEKAKKSKKSKRAGRNRLHTRLDSRVPSSEEEGGEALGGLASAINNGMDDGGVV